MVDEEAADVLDGPGGRERVERGVIAIDLSGGQPAQQVLDARGFRSFSQYLVLVIKKSLQFHGSIRLR